MLTKSQEISRGKYLSFLLRHNLHKSGLCYTQQGWVLVSDLLAYLKWSQEDLLQIVSNNNKSRYELSACKTKIRACQGHSIEVDLQLPKLVPPEFLFHGTAKENLESILREGLKKQSRHAVHLSESISTAMQVGGRHSKNVVILKVSALALHREKNAAFEKSSNGVWLVPEVPPQFLEVKTIMF